MSLYSEIIGSGEPVLVLHGGFCSLETLRPQADALAANFTVHAFERAGHGRSPDIDGAYSYDGGVSDAIDYLDANGLASAHIVGYSDGAIIGLLMALDHPQRVRSLVAISGNLDPSGFVGALPDEVVLNATADVWDEPDSTRLAYNALSPDGPEHAEVVLDKLMAMWTTEPNIDPADLARITAPTLVVAGDRDTIRPDHSLLIAASIPTANLCIVPGATHGLVEKRADFLSFVLKDFLAGVAPV